MRSLSPLARSATLALIAIGIALLPLLAAPAQDAGRDPAAFSALTFDRDIQVDVVAMACPAGFDNGHADDVCLAYNGQIPGPTWVFQQGDRVRITVTNRIAETIGALSAPQAVKDELASINVSLHRHGILVPHGADGVAPAPSSNMQDSTIGPGDTRAYPFVASFEGAWHYHDHSMFGNTAHGVIERGLFGAFVTTLWGETTNAIDLHLLDAGANGGLGLDTTAPAGERFDIDLVGLGNYAWNAVLYDPNDDIVDERKVGPGVSRLMTVDHPVPGVYRWEAWSPTNPSLSFSGTVSVQ